MVDIEVDRLLGGGGGGKQIRNTLYIQIARHGGLHPNYLMFHSSSQSGLWLSGVEYACVFMFLISYQRCGGRCIGLMSQHIRFNLYRWKTLSITKSTSNFATL